jgi:hypothetical protein
MPTQQKDAERQFRAMLARLSGTAAWTTKQQLELQMASDAAQALRRTAEDLRRSEADAAGVALAPQMLKYTQAIDFVLSALSAQKSIHPATLRVVFRLAGLPVNEDYPR